MRRRVDTEEAAISISECGLRIAELKSQKRLVGTEEAAISTSECGLRPPAQRASWFGEIAELKSQKRLVDTEEAAKVLGTSPRSIRRWFERGKLEGELKPSDKGGGKSGMKLFVWIDEEAQNGDSPLRAGEPFGPEADSTILAEVLIRKSGTVPKSRTRVGRGEPGCHVVTPMTNGEPQSENQNVTSLASVGSSPGGPRGICDHNKAGGEGVDFIEAPPFEKIIETPSTSTVPTSDGGAISNLPAILVPQILDNRLQILDRKANPNLEKIGYLRFAILNAWREELSRDHKPKTQVITEFLQLYNSGLLLPTIYNDIDSISRATLYLWDKAEKLGGVRALIPQYGGPSGSKITDYEKYILLNILLHQNRLKIGSAIKFTKAFLSYKKIESPSSEATLRRFIDEFKRTRYDAWVEAREGAKALNDKCLPYAERNWRLLTVGEGLVADGHRLNFQVINPFTGKKCRATIVLFWDWKSAYLLGWEIMLEESIQCIASALRNGILTLGKIPKWLLIDNGKAFKANVFTSDIDLEDGITYGMFATLGIHTHFSQAYNPQEKPLERFWGTFNNWFERLVPSYTGASIPDKPPYMLRNEKDAQARHNEWMPKIEEVQEMLLKFREFYSDQPSRGRDGLTPREIFEAEKGPGVDPDELTYLMMAKEIKSVGRNGVTWNGWHYYDEALYGYRDKVICRYTHSDYSKIYLFSLKNQFLCVARPVEQVHPMASESEFPKDQEAVKQISSLKNRAKRSTKNLINLIESHKEIDWENSLKRSPEASQIVQVIENKNPKAVNISPFVDGVSYSQDETPPPRYKPPRGWSGYFEHWERYDYHREQDPAMLAQDDLDFIGWYKTTSEYEAVYGPKKNTRLLAVK